MLDETAELKKGTMTVGVAASTPGSPARWRTARPSSSWRTSPPAPMPCFDFRLYLPKPWCGDRKRRERAKVPEDLEFATKTELGAHRGHAIRLGGRR